MSKDIVEDSIKCLANMEIKETTYQVARNVVLDEIERLHSIIKELREYIETEYLSKFDDFERPLRMTDKNDWNKVLEILDKENT